MMNAVNMFAKAIDACTAAGQPIDYEAIAEQVSDLEGVEPDVLMEAYLDMMRGAECDDAHA